MPSPPSHPYEVWPNRRHHRSRRRSDRKGNHQPVRRPGNEPGEKRAQNTRTRSRFTTKGYRWPRTMETHRFYPVSLLLRLGLLPDRQVTPLRNWGLLSGPGGGWVRRYSCFYYSNIRILYILPCFLLVKCYLDVLYWEKTWLMRIWYFSAWTLVGLVVTSEVQVINPFTPELKKYILPTF